MVVKDATHHLIGSNAILLAGLAPSTLGGLWVARDRRLSCDAEWIAVLLTFARGCHADHSPCHTLLTYRVSHLGCQWPKQLTLTVVREPIERKVL